MAGVVAQLVLYYMAFHLWIFTFGTLLVTSALVAHGTSAWTSIHEIVLVLMFFETVPVVLLGLPVAYVGSWLGSGVQLGLSSLLGWN